MSLKNVINININLTSSNNGGLFTLEFEPRDGDCNFPNETEINSLKPPVRRESPMKWKWKWKCQTGGKEQVGVRLGVWNRRSWWGKSGGQKINAGVCYVCLLWANNIHLSPAWKQKQHAMWQSRNCIRGRMQWAVRRWLLSLVSSQRSSPCPPWPNKCEICFFLASEMKFISCNFAVKCTPTQKSVWRLFNSSVTKYTTKYYTFYQICSSLKKLGCSQ